MKRLFRKIYKKTPVPKRFRIQRFNMVHYIFVLASNCLYDAEQPKVYLKSDSHIPKNFFIRFNDSS